MYGLMTKLLSGVQLYKGEIYRRSTLAFLEGKRVLYCRLMAYIQRVTIFVSFRFVAVGGGSHQCTRVLVLGVGETSYELQDISRAIVVPLLQWI